MRWRRDRGTCPDCGGGDVGKVGFLHHTPWCVEVGGDGIKPQRALPVLSSEDATRLRRLRSYRNTAAQGPYDTTPTVQP